MSVSRKRTLAQHEGATSAVDLRIVPAEESRARILVVDDDERNLFAIQTVLQDVGDVVTARSGEEALRHLLKTEFAAILLDVYMPGMDGYETAQMIRSREQTRRIPIIFLSAVNKETEHLMRGYAMGAVDYVFKPVDPIVLQSKVAVFVDLFQMTREIQRNAAIEQQLLDANLRTNAELLRAERELRLAEQRQGAIIDSLPIILYLEPIDATPRAPDFVSGNFTALTGFDFEEIRANPALWAERLHPEDRDRVRAVLDARGDGRAFAVEYRWQCADGRYRHFLDQAVLLRDADGTPVEYAGTLLDITERKDLETQLLHVRKMDAIGKLTGGIAHDFNNLLAAVIGGLGMLERRVEMSEENLKIFAMTRHAAEQGTELVARLMAFARKQRLEPAPVDVDALTRSVTDLLAHTLGGLVALEWQVTGPLWQPYADEGQLELALLNLIINARDAMPEGGKVTVIGRNASVAEGEAGLAPGEYVVLEVHDTGSGISPELLERVTEPFFTTKPVGKGTGLGLSMVYGFAEQSGGAMRISSRIGEGTQVELWLPRATEEVPENPEVAEVEPIAPVPEALTILLVDDHDGVRETTAAMLTDMGYHVVKASCGQDAIELFGEDCSSVDVLITDYAMPELSGIEVINRFRELKPALPAIIVTGNADVDMLDRARGVTTLIKPFSFADLRGSIAAVSCARQAAAN